MLRELGFDGVGYLLWLDDPDTKLRMFGEDLEANLRTLDEAGLPLLAVGATVNVNPNAPPYNPRLVEAIRKLKGRPLTVGVVLKGFPPGDERGTKPAVKILRQLGDLAAESNVRISVYHHVGDYWAESFIHTLRVVKKVDHPCVGAHFNVLHWLIVDGDKDYRPVLRAGAEKIFVVTICGSKVGSKARSELIQPLDRGDFDNRELLATLREIGYRGPIGLMCFGIPGDAREHLQRSMNVWKAWKAEWTKESP
ncbi:MAG: sugar phosphate isomerase/epimerase family protein [Planctomycetota bacterium]